MCGIFGFVTRSPSVAAGLDPGAAEAALAHRGPDGAGRFSGSAGEVHCTLVHTRLAIIDLSDGGRQPMQSPDGRHQIVFNGEIYNHAEIRRELEALGERFRSTSDTEVLLAAHVRWGKGALDRLRGMFAFAIWDAHAGSLFIARDRLGIKPLYLAELPGGGLAFASEIRALLAAGAAPRRLSRAGLRSYLRWGSVAEPLTILDGVRTLLPGHLATWSGAVHEEPYWSLTASPSRSCTVDEAAELVRPVLREAVRLRLVSDVPVGVFLSGGIDSAVIASLAARDARDLRTFTVAFDERELSEGEHAASLARHLGCRHETLLLRHEEARRELDKAVEALDQPSADGINTYFVSRAVRDAGIKVALSGLGGDEVFAGYHYFRQFRTALGVARRVPGPVSRALDTAGRRGWLDRFGARGAKLAALGNAHDARGVYGALRCMFTGAQVDALLGVSGPSPGTDDGASMPEALRDALARGSADPLNALSVLELSNYLRNTLLRDTDTMSMAHALEVRVPLLDHRLVETVLPLASSVKVGGSTNKPLLVASAPGLSRSVTHRKKQGFVLPFEAWFRGPLRDEVRRDLLEGGLDAALSRPVLEATWEHFTAGHLSASRIWTLAALSAWLGKYGVTP